MKYKKNPKPAVSDSKIFKKSIWLIINKIKHPPNTVNLTYKDDNYVLT